MTGQNSLKSLFAWLAFIVGAAALAACGKDTAIDPRDVEEAAAEIGEVPVEEPDVSDPQVQFLEDYKQQEGVIERPSGLLIKVIEEGTGDYPSFSSDITAHYTGKLIDGTVFDTTRETGQPFTFTMDQVIKGWQEALMLMREGAHYEVVIPAELGYGSAGAQGLIPPGATLVFDIELLEVTRPQRTR